MATKFQQELIDAAKDWNRWGYRNRNISKEQEAQAKFMKLVQRAVDISNLDLTCRSMIRDLEGKHRT